MQRQAVRAQYSLRALWGWALAALGAAIVLGGCASIVPGGDRRPPIVFVHGNGDDAAVWTTTIWRFESNGWPRNRLHAIDFPWPLARDDDTKAQPGRSSADDQMRYLSQQVDAVLAASGASRVVLIGHSRGGYAIRNYIENGGGAKKVSHVILEVTPGPKWMTLRSDGNDKYAQPDGRWLGRPGFATGVDSSSPALKGARNVGLGPVDHREAAFGPRAFEHMWRFLTGDWPVRTAIVPESSPTLDGRIFRPETNLPMAGVRVEVYEVAPVTGERLGGPLHARTTGEDGRWGPMPARPDVPYEFVVSAPAFATMHLYRSAFPRSSSLVQMRPETLTDAQRNAGSVVTMTRPRGYFDLQRDRMSLDGAPLPGVTPGVPGVSSATLLLPSGTARTVVAEFNGERIAVRTWPAAANEAAVAELHY